MIIENTGNFSVMKTFDCGQCFRFEPVGEDWSEVRGTVGDYPVRIKDLGGAVEIDGDGERDFCGMCVMEDLSIPLESGEAAQAVLDVPESVRAPVYPGMHLGTAKLVVDGQVYGVGEVVASERVRADGIRMDVRRIVAHWVL